jgi:hypothetical protein
MVPRLISEQIELPDSPEQIFQEFLDRGWTDGLPIIPPTEEAVTRAVDYVGRDPQTVIANLPPKWGAATIEKIAINAVMAGCLPEYMPVIIAAVEAMAEKPANLTWFQVTTHPSTPLLIVNGPIVKSLKINSGTGAFGPCFRSNATIGRAIRLILINIGGSIPGLSSMSTQGQPSKYSFCIAENEAENPWEALHVERGFKPMKNTVTVIATENPHNINDHGSTNAQDLLFTIANSINKSSSNNVISQAGNPVLALCPEHAVTIARDGYSKNDIRKYLFENARVPFNRLTATTRKRFFPALKENESVPIFGASQDLMIIVVGGQGKHSSYLPSAGNNWAVTKLVG